MCLFSISIIYADYFKDIEDSGFFFFFFYPLLTAEKDFNREPIPGRDVLPEKASVHIRRTSLLGMTNIC